MKKSFTLKLWKVMKLCALQWIIALMFAGVSVAYDAEAQVLDQEISINLSGVPFEEALQQIQDLTNVKFFYSPGQLTGEGPVTLQVNGRALGEVLEGLLGPRGIEYRVHEREATITLRKSAATQPQLPDNSEAGSKKRRALVEVTGTVTDGSGEPMAGVNVVVKGTTIGTTTDSEGRYRIDASAEATLVFSFIGFSSFETRVGGRTVIDVVLQENITSLGEVVVNAGYYSTTRKLQTGSIVKIEAEEIAQQPVSDPLAALQGRVAGMEIVQSSGVPGSNFSVRIRGRNSISSGNDPLYIIDGVPYTSTPLSFGETSGTIQAGGTSPLSILNPADIESIEILKDADATSIYGSRGANGVVLITTKRGESGATKLDADVYTGIAQVPKKMSLLNTPQYLEMRREAFQNDLITPNSGNAPDLLTWDATRYTDWQDELLGGTAQITNAQVTLSGGDANTQFRIGSAYRRETTVFPGDNVNQRTSVSAAINNTSVNRKLNVNFSVNYGLGTSNMLSEDLTGQALRLAPNAPALYDSNGKLSWDGWTSSNVNPLAYTERTFEARTRNLLANAVISYSILEELDGKVNMGYTNTMYDAVTVIPESAMGPDAFQVNHSRFARSEFNNWIVEPQLNWKTQLGEGRVDVLVGTTFLEQRTQGLAQYANGFTSEALMRNISAAADIINGTSYFTQYRYHAVFGRVNYDYKSRYIINATGRRDGSSRFGPGKQFAFFKAIGVAWVFSNEPFIRNGLPFLSHGKIRASYGTTGNDQIGDYQFLDSYTTTQEYNGVIGLSPTRLYNPNFAWEENRKLELGLELGAVADRVLVAIAYYRNRSDNQLVGQPLAPTTGFSSIQANFPAEIENTGLEVEVTSKNIANADVNWTTDINFTFPRNKLLSFPSIERYPEYDEQYEIGEPLTILKRYRYTGIDPTTGFFMAEDTNNDGEVNYQDRQIPKFRGRRFFGGILNTIKYRGFQLDMLIQYVNQEGFDYMQATGSTPGTMSNQPVAVLDRWQEEGSDAAFQAYTTSGSGLNAYSIYSQSDAQISDASFVRLKNIALSYNLTRRLHETFFPGRIRLYLQAQNVVTFTHYKGLDPELPGRANLPSLRTVVAGIQVFF